MSHLYRVLDPDFYRAQAESRARQRRHMRRKAVLRWLLSREVRIAIAAIMGMLVILASAFAGQAPRDGASRSPSAAVSTSTVLSVGRSEPLILRQCDVPRPERPSYAGVSLRAQTLDGTPDPSRRTPAQSAKAFVAAQFLLALSLALGCLVVLWGFRLARQAEREAEGKVTEGTRRRLLGE